VGTTNNKLNLKAVAAKVGSVPSARKGGSGKRDVDALTFFGGFEQVNALVRNFPEVTADELQDNIGRLYLKKTILTNALGRRELSETKNVDCFRLTGDYEFKYVGTGDLSDSMLGTKLPASSIPADYWILDDEGTGVGINDTWEWTGKVQVERVKFTTNVPMTLKQPVYREMWSLRELAAYAAPISAVIAHLERCYGAIATARLSAEQLIDL
jgi:hypothetical protein